jgi:hypothetical protein
MMGEEVRERELRPLRLINDNYEKIVLLWTKVTLSPMMGLRL